MSSVSPTMSESPLTLREICLDAICANLLEVFEMYYEDDKEESCNKRLRFRDSEIFLIKELSEDLLLRLGEKRWLCDSTLSLFSSKNTRLRNAVLKNAYKLTYRCLKILREHNVTNLECVRLKNVTVNQLLDCLSDWTKENLISLNVSHCTFIDSSRHYIMGSLGLLRNLKNLNVSYTEFNQHAFQLICDDLRNLEKLDISGTSVNNFSPLLSFSERLTSLTAIDFMLDKQQALILTQLNALRHLDVSIANKRLHLSDGITTLIEDPSTLPELISLDISGWRDSVTPELLEPYIKSHKKLRYLGIVLNAVVFEPQFSDPTHETFHHHLIVAGVGTETQIKVTLKKYFDRPLYVQKALYHLFQLSSPYQSARPDLFELVLLAMGTHRVQFGVQMAATACLYNLTRGDLSKHVHPSLLSRAVSLTLNAMEEFPQEYQLQKNALLTLCSDRILQDVNFEMFRCARLVLDSLCYFDEINMNRMAVAICSILAAKISTAETSELGARPSYMHKLLSMVQSRVTSKQSDITLKFTLSALWNLTDESGATCRVFLEQGGAGLFLNVLKTFRSDSAIETKVLGLLNNIAEVEKLRHSLMLNSLMEELHLLLKSEHIDVSYFAAGIVAHLASDGATYWTVTKYSRDEMLQELESAVVGWKVPDSEMVAYRSFKPFFPLLRLEMSYQVQLWAVWAVHHVCSKNPSRYCLMLREEKGVEVFRELMGSQETHPEIRRISGQILGMLSESL